MVRRNFKGLDSQDLFLIYKTYIRSNLEYSIQSWSPHLRIDSAQKLSRKPQQNLLPRHRKLSYGQRPQKLGLTTPETRRRRDNLTDTFTIMTGGELSSKQFFHLPCIRYQTSLKPQIKDSETAFQTQPREIHLQQMSGQRMQQFTPVCSTVSTANMFRSIMDKYWKDMSSKIDA